MFKTICLSTALALLGAAAHAGEYDGALDTFFYRTNTPNKKNATVGRWLYTGTAPRFDSQNLEFFVSKVGLTVRIRAWVPEAMPAAYGEFLLKRWKRIYSAFVPNSGVYFEGLQSVDELMAKANSSAKAWLKIDGQYLGHELDGHGADIFGSAQDKNAYKKEILTALARSYLGDDSLTLEKMLDMANKAEAGDEAFLAAFREKTSKPLFEKRFNSQFTKSQGQGTLFNGKPIQGVLGYLTFVYPIAATADGPFSIPSEGVKKLPIDGAIEARWWSDKWGDEYGGLPFLMFTTSAIAFHGPITHNGAMDIWYVKRDFASHGCHRMNASDVMEMRALIPSDAVKKSAGDIPIYEAEWLDVTDANGKTEAVDVAYYDVPESAGASDVSKFLVENDRATWHAKHYSKYDGKLPSKNHYDPKSDSFTGLPQYSGEGGALKRVGIYKSAVPVHTYAYHPLRVIQYREDGAKLSGYDDVNGKYPPGYFESP